MCVCSYLLAASHVLDRLWVRQEFAGQCALLRVTRHHYAVQLGRTPSVKCVCVCLFKECV